MSKSNSDKTSIRYYVLLNLALASVLVTFLFSAYKLTNINLSIQREAFESKFSSRLFFKTISKLQESYTHLTQFNVSKNIKDLENAEDSFLSSYSDYKILLNELATFKTDYQDLISPDFEVLKSKIDLIFQSPSQSHKLVQESLNFQHTMIKKLYEDESFIWQKEAMKFAALSEVKSSNYNTFTITFLFFIVLEIAILYFTYLRHKMVKKINIQNEQLIIQARMSTLGVMSAELAHEINTPLMVIDGRLKQVQQELKRESYDHERIVKNVETIVRNSNKIQSIVKNFKTLSKDGKLDNYEKVKIKDLLFDLNEMVVKRLEIFNISIHYITPESTIELYVRRIQILQVLVNLINNSIDAIKSSPERWIKIEALVSENEMYIYITDSGKGIPKEISDKLFSPFFTTKPSHEGTGLGLSLSKKIMLEHGGNLFYDKANTNTCFVLKLPKV